MELEQKEVKELFKFLGSIEQKQIDTCAAVGEIQKNIRALPCQHHLEEIGTRVTWKQLWGIIIICMGVFFGALSLHYDITRHHISNEKIHWERVENAMDKD